MSLSLTTNQGGNAMRLALTDRTNQNEQFTVQHLSRKRPREEDHDSCPLKITTKSSLFNNQHAFPISLEFSSPLPSPTLLPAPSHRAGASFRRMRNARIGLGISQEIPLSTRPALLSFVSSERSDVYQIRDSTGLSRPPFNCTFSNGSRKGQSQLLAIATEHGDVDICNTTEQDLWESAPPRTVINAHQDAVYDVCWRDDDRVIASSSGDNSIRLHDVEKQVTIGTFVGHVAGVKNIVWDPNHPSIIASGGRDGNISIWDTRVFSDSDENGCENAVFTIKQAHDPVARRKRNIPRSAAKSVTSVLYLPHTQHQLISSGSYDGIILKWDVRSAKASKHALLETLEDPTLSLTEGKRSRGISSLALASDSKMIYGLGADGVIYPYLTETLQSHLPLRAPLTRPNPPSGTLSFYQKLKTSPCGRWLASGGSDGTAYLYDIGSGRFNDDIPVVLRGHENDVTGLDWATSDVLATCADDRTVRVWRSKPDQALKCRADEELKWHWKWAQDEFKSCKSSS